MMLPYVRRQRISTPVFGAMVATCALFLIVPMLPSMPYWIPWVFIPGAALMIVILLTMDHLTVVVTREEFVAGFRLFRSRTRIADIVAARQEQVRLLPHGIGIHVTLAGTLAITARTGPGVRIERTAGLPLVVSTDAPSDLLAALAAAGARGIEGAAAP